MQFVTLWWSPLVKQLIKHWQTSTYTLSRETLANFVAKIRIFLMLFVLIIFSQLFRRVAAALPGMESTTDKANKDDLIEVKLKDTPQEPQPQTSGCACWVNTHIKSLVVEIPVWSFLFFFAENELINLDSGITYHFIKVDWACCIPKPPNWNVIY